MHTMRLVPAKSIKIAPPRYDAEARALYVYVGAAQDRQVSRTRSADGINFDCNRAGIVVGIEVLVNSPRHLVEAPIRLPDIADEGGYDLLFDDDPDVDDLQIYDASTHTIQIGTRSEDGKLVRVGTHVLIALNEAGKMTIWISGLDIAPPSDSDRI